jgi:hypothetical protein
MKDSRSVGAQAFFILKLAGLFWPLFFTMPVLNLSWTSHNQTGPGYGFWSWQSVWQMVMVLVWNQKLPVRIPRSG